MKRIILITLLIILTIPVHVEIAKSDFATLYVGKSEYIVDETMKKIKNPFVKKKLKVLEEELAAEVIKQRRETLNVRYRNL